MAKKKILAGAIGDCVHIAGIYEYLKIASFYGFSTNFLGVAVKWDVFIDEIIKNKPDIVCISYRLSPESLKSILNLFCNRIKKEGMQDKTIYYFGGTSQCIDIARQYDLFEEFFCGEEPIAFIRKTLFKDDTCITNSESSPKVIVKEKAMLKKDNYYPILRHHFGLPDLTTTIQGIKEIADSEQLDIISLAPDQNAQEHFFSKDNIDENLKGSGGVPIRTESDILSLKHASQTGNFPSLKIYSGTNNLIKWAEMSVRLLNIPWGTVPLFWYSQLDGRSNRPLINAIRENMEAIKWYADRNIAVEVNDSHQWSLRECSDVMAVVSFYLAAYNAKKLGVKKYIAQFMFNTPRLISAKMDLAKMLAKIELIQELEDETFQYLKQVRAGLTHFSIDQDVAKGQLAASTSLALSIKPNIIHVVSYCEGNHEAGPKEIIESCKIVKGVLRNLWNGNCNAANDSEVIARKDYLVKESKKILELIKNIYDKFSSDPLSDPIVLEDLVIRGVLDAPHLKNNKVAQGIMTTNLINGGYDCVDSCGISIGELQRANSCLRVIEKKDNL